MRRVCWRVLRFPRQIRRFRSPMEFLSLLFFPFLEAWIWNKRQTISIRDTSNCYSWCICCIWYRFRHFSNSTFRDSNGLPGLGITNHDPRVTTCSRFVGFCDKETAHPIRCIYLSPEERQDILIIIIIITRGPHLSPSYTGRRKNYKKRSSEKGKTNRQRK